MVVSEHVTELSISKVELYMCEKLEEIGLFEAEYDNDAEVDERTALFTMRTASRRDFRTSRANDLIWTGENSVQWQSRPSEVRESRDI